MTACVHGLVTGNRYGVRGVILKLLTTAQVVQFAKFVTLAAGPEDSGNPLLVLASAVGVLTPTARSARRCSGRAGSAAATGQSDRREAAGSAGHRRDRSLARRHGAAMTILGWARPVLAVPCGTAQIVKIGAS
jgi:hypothetical protein